MLLCHKVLCLFCTVTFVSIDVLYGVVCSVLMFTMRVNWQAESRRVGGERSQRSSTTLAGSRNWCWRGCSVRCCYRTYSWRLTQTLYVGFLLHFSVTHAVCAVLNLNSIIVVFLAIVLRHSHFNLLISICCLCNNLYIKVPSSDSWPVSECRTAGMPIMSHCQPYADH